ncbi:unnamed protein product [Amoebophrya sp. A25]|nr:unnamed protein product [Amoebophrya sp. A25]|eukprot:GSA25T00001313001.1
MSPVLSSSLREHFASFICPVWRRWEDGRGQKRNACAFSRRDPVWCGPIPNTWWLPPRHKGAEKARATATDHPGVMTAAAMKVRMRNGNGLNKAEVPDSDGPRGLKNIAVPEDSTDCCTYRRKYNTGTSRVQRLRPAHDRDRNLAENSKAVILDVKEVQVVPKNNHEDLDLDAVQDANAPDTKRRQKVLLLVRSLAPTWAQLERIQEWRSACHKNCEAIDLDFLISFDVTHVAARRQLYRTRCEAALREELKNVGQEIVESRSLLESSNSREGVFDSAPRHDDKLYTLLSKQTALESRLQSYKESKTPENFFLPSSTDIAKCFHPDEIHTYNCHDLEHKLYPGWTELRKHVNQQQITIPGPSKCTAWAWGLHNECVLEAVRWKVGRKIMGSMITTSADMEKSSSMGSTAEQLPLTTALDHYDYIWVLEDDVGFSGSDIAQTVIAGHIDDHSDLLSKWYEGPWAGWVWQFTTTGEFYRRTGRDFYLNSVVAPEFVQRFSKRLLREIADWSTSGAIAWSELSTPTICFMKPELRCGELRSDVIGDIFVWNGKVTEDDWETICLRDNTEERSGLGVGREKGCNKVDDDVTLKRHNMSTSSAQDVIETGFCTDNPDTSLLESKTKTSFGRLYHALKF